MEDLVNIDEFLRVEKEGGFELLYWANRWGVSRGLISHWRTGRRRIGWNKAETVFKDLREHNRAWTPELYRSQFKELRRRFELRDAKLREWKDAVHTKGLTPPCGGCGDSLSQHGDNGTGICKGCELKCKSYTPWVRRGS
jgi:hypothetical protein